LKKFDGFVFIFPVICKCINSLAGTSELLLNVEDSSTPFFNLSARWGWVVKAQATLPPREDTRYPLYWAVTNIISYIGFGSV